jgi:SAM-dependent methyltransferase
VKTASLWGRAPSRFYRFLNAVAASSGTRRELAVLGCADGKYVLPAARKGFNVLAIDVDRIALYGGTKQGVGGRVEMPGLTHRLKVEGLSEKVEVICKDFTVIEARPMGAVFTSGAIQYSYNLPKTADELLMHALEFVCPGGLFYMDYMLPYEAKYVGRPNCPDEQWWRLKVAELNGWTVISHRVLPPTRDKAHVEYPVDHYHQWGHLLMRRS